MRVTWLRFLIAGFLLFAPIALSQTASETLEREARSAFKAGRFREAALKFQDSAQAAADSDRKGRMELQSGWSHYNDRNQKLAREALKRALAADPQIDIVPEFFSPEFVALAEDVKKVAPASIVLTEADMKELKRVASEKLLDRMYNEVIYDLTAIPRERMDLESWQLLARAYDMAGKPDAAAEARKAGGTAESAKWPTAPGTLPAGSVPAATATSSVGELLSGGRAYLERGDAFQAQAFANRVIDVDPGSSEAYRLLGDAFFARGEGKLSEATWLKSLQLEPKNQGTLLTLSEYYLAAKNWDSALEMLKRLAEANPAAHGSRLVQFGRDMRKAGDLVRARQIFNEAAATLHKDPAVQNEFAGVLVQTKEFDSAVEIMQRAMALSPSPLLRANFASVLRYKGKDVEATAEYRKALEEDPKNIPALNGLANTLAATGKHADAVSLYARVLEISPANADAILGMGRALRSSGNLAGASEFLAKGLSLEDADILNEAGAVAYERGMFAEAIGFFEKALWKRPDFAVAKTNREKAWHAAEFLKGLEQPNPSAAPAKPGA